MVIQWVDTQPKSEGWVRIGISGAYSTLSIFGSSAQFLELPTQFSWLMSEEAWAAMWAMEGTPERSIQLTWVPAGGAAVDMNEPEPAMSAALPIELTDDEIGGAVYFEVAKSAPEFPHFCAFFSLFSAILFAFLFFHAGLLVFVFPIVLSYIFNNIIKAIGKKKSI